MCIVIVTLSVTIYLCSVFPSVFCQCSNNVKSVQANDRPITITSPGYGEGGYTSDTSCQWEVTTDPSHSMLYSLHIDGVVCTGDSVKIYYGPFTDFVENWDDCGTNITFGPYSDNPFGYMTIVFTASNNSRGGRGFKLTFLAVIRNIGTSCFEVPILLTAQYNMQYLSSTEFPSDYKGNSSCEWTVVSLYPSIPILLDIVYIDLEPSDECTYDSLQITNEQSGSVRRYCDRNTFSKSRFTSKWISIRFESDERMEYKGFFIKYQLLDIFATECLQAQLDILFILDTTVSAGQTGFLEQKRLTMDIISELQTSNFDVQFSIMTYADTPVPHIWFGDYNTTDDILNATFRIPYIEGHNRATHSAFDFANEIFCPCNGARNNSMKIILFFTFGPSDIPEATHFFSESLRQGGIKVISIGVGETNNKREVTSMAWSEEYALFPTSAADIVNIEISILTLICNLASENNSTKVINFNISEISPSASDTISNFTFVSTVSLGASQNTLNITSSISDLYTVVSTFATSTATTTPPVSGMQYFTEGSMELSTSVPHTSRVIDPRTSQFFTIDISPSRTNLYTQILESHNTDQEYTSISVIHLMSSDSIFLSDFSNFDTSTTLLSLLNLNNLNTETMHSTSSLKGRISMSFVDTDTYSDDYSVHSFSASQDSTRNSIYTTKLFSYSNQIFQTASLNSKEQTLTTKESFSYSNHIVQTATLGTKEQTFLTIAPTSSQKSGYVKSTKENSLYLVSTPIVHSRYSLKSTNLKTSSTTIVLNTDLVTFPNTKVRTPSTPFSNDNNKENLEAGNTLIAAFVSSVLFLFTFTAFLLIAIIWCVHKHRRQKMLNAVENDTDTYIDTPLWIDLANSIANDKVLGHHIGVTNDKQHQQNKDHAKQNNGRHQHIGLQKHKAAKK